jgi:hypothetical protein
MRCREIKFESQNIVRRLFLSIPKIIAFSAYAGPN